MPGTPAIRRVSRGVRLRQAAILGFGAVLLQLWVGRDAARLSFSWTPLLIGVTYTVAAVSGGRRGSYWPTGLVLLGWGAAVVAFSEVRPDLDGSGVYAFGIGLGVTLAAVAERLGARVDLLAVGVTAMAAGAVLALAVRVESLDDATTYATGHRARGPREPRLRGAGRGNGPRLTGLRPRWPRRTSGDYARAVSLARRSRRLLIALVVLGAGPAATPAAARTPLGLTACRAIGGTYQCSGVVRSWDGVPLDTTVTLPSQGALAAGALPLVAELNGLGNSKWEYLDPASKAYTDNAYGWARRGYAVLTATARGFWGSCGTPESRSADPVGCARGWIHLADTRYEVRDAQELIARLVDDGVADPRRLGVTGDSYGGGQTIALAALSDRVMLPDGSLVPWRTRAGVRLRLAAAAPVIPWTDLVGAIAPNGLTRSVGITPSEAIRRPVGVFKASIANAIFAATTAAIGPGQPVGEPFVPGRPMGYLAPPGADPSADVAAYVARADAGSPTPTPTSPVSSRTSSASAPPTGSTRARPRRRCWWAAASRTTSSRSTRRCATSTACAATTPGCRCTSCSGTSATSAPATRSPTGPGSSRRSTPGWTTT